MKIRNMAMTIALVLLFTIFALGSGESTPSNDDQGGGTVVTTIDDTNLGDYHITIDSCRLTVDYEGDPVVIIKYIFKNVSHEDPISFMLAVSDSVYQHGVGLNEAYFLADGVEYNSDNATKDIKMGGYIEVEVAYELNDTTTEIEVEVEQFLGFSKEKVTKVFQIVG